MFFWLSRPVNLTIAALTFGLSAYISADRSFSFVKLDIFWHQLALLLGIMATGYWVNDVFDHKIDLINKPERTLLGRFISAKKTLSVYFVGSFMLSLYSLSVMPAKFSLINLATIAVLYSYARWFKQRAIVGNLLIAALTALVVLCGALLIHVKWALVWGMVFAFVVTFIREVTKDIEDLDGDLSFGLRTLPIQLGLRSTKQVLAVSYVVFILMLTGPVVQYWILHQTLLTDYLYFSFYLVHIPTYFLMYLSQTATRPAHFGFQSLLLKVTTVNGLFSLLFL